MNPNDWHRTCGVVAFAGAGAVAATAKGNEDVRMCICANYRSTCVVASEEGSQAKEKA